jgi:hypothetical protein
MNVWKRRSKWGRGHNRKTLILCHTNCIRNRDCHFKVWKELRPWSWVENDRADDFPFKEG